MNQQKFAENLHKFYFALTMAETYLDATNDALKGSGLVMHEEKRDMNAGSKKLRSVLSRLHRMYLKEPENQLAFAEKADFLEELFDAAVEVENENRREELINIAKNSR